MKKNILGIALIICIGILVYYLYNPNIQNENIASDLANESIALSVSEKIILDRGGQDEALTCTGMSYDNTHERFFIGNYGKTTASDTKQNASILVCDKNFAVLDEIKLSNTIKNIQGVAYSDTLDSLFFTDTIKIYEIDLEGNLKSLIQLEEYEKYQPNSLIYDERDNTLWVLCFYDYLLHIDIDGKVIDTIKCSYRDQDQICFDENYNILFSVGADYNGENNYIGVIDVKEKSTKILYKVLESYAIEGIYLDEKVLYVANDGIYHDSKIRENYISKYNITKE